MRQKLLLLFLLAFVAAPRAQANYLFSWEGSSNLFQGSFEVTDAEIQPNQFYYPLSLTNSLSITSPSGRTYRWSYDDGFGVNASSPVFAFYFELSFPKPDQQGHSLLLEADRDSIQEFALIPGQPFDLLYGETGQWEVSEIPEPSLTMFLALGFVAWLIKQRKSS